MSKAWEEALEQLGAAWEADEVESLANLAKGTYRQFADPSAAVEYLKNPSDAR